MPFSWYIQKVNIGKVKRKYKQSSFDSDLNPDFRVDISGTPNGDRILKTGEKGVSCTTPFFMSWSVVPGMIIYLLLIMVVKT